MRILALVPIGIAASMVALWLPTPLEATPEQNKAAVRYVFQRAWNEASFDSLVSPPRASACGLRLRCA